MQSQVLEAPATEDSVAVTGQMVVLWGTVTVTTPPVASVEVDVWYRVEVVHWVMPSVNVEVLGLGVSVAVTGQMVVLWGTVTVTTPPVASVEVEVWYRVEVLH